MIVLLDYQFTLVRNMKSLPWPPTEESVPKEEFRPELVEALKGHKVVLITVRWDSLKDVTMRNIAAKAPGLVLEDALFNRWRVPAPESKRRNMVDRVFPKYGRDEEYLAIESNELTRAMYGKLGITAVRHDHPDLKKMLAGNLPRQESLL